MKDKKHTGREAVLPERQGLSRRQFLGLGGSGLAGMLLLGLTGCAGAVELNEPAVNDPRGILVFSEAEPDSRLPAITRVNIQTPQGQPFGLLHPVEGARGAVIMVGSITGGVSGPSGIYKPLAEWLQAGGISALRLECRELDNLEACVYDVQAAIHALGRQGVEQIVLVGWSWGGVVMINAGLTSARVAGVAAISSEMTGVEAVADLAPRSLLLIHGTSDYAVPAYSSEALYEQANEPKELVLYEQGGHNLQEFSADLLEKLYTWSQELLPMV